MPLLELIKLRPGNSATPAYTGVTARLRTVIIAPVAGAALGYATARGGTICRCVANTLIAALLPDGFARGSTMYGTAYIADPQTGATADRIRRLADHEAHHSDRWAVATVLGGPTALLLLYAADESLFPGAHNHFERAAGLADGGYATPPDSPPAPGRILFLAAGPAAGLSVGYLVAHRRATAPHVGAERARTAGHAHPIAGPTPRGARSAVGRGHGRQSGYRRPRQRRSTGRASAVGRRDRGRRGRRRVRHRRRRHPGTLRRRTCPRPAARRRHGRDPHLSWKEP